MFKALLIRVWVVVKLICVFNLYSFLVVASSNESQASIINSVQHEMAQRRKQKSQTNGNVVNNGVSDVVELRNPPPAIIAPVGNGLTVIAPIPFMTRQDSRLSVKSLIESIENTSKSTKVSGGSQSGSTSSLNSLSAMEQQHDLTKNVR